MTLKPSLSDLLWMASGAAVLLVVVLVVLHFQESLNPAEQLALKASRLELVGQVRLSLASAAEAEKSAVMAMTDDESQAFADQARAATATAEQAQGQLATLLDPAERDLLAQFSQAFTEYQRVDRELLDLAVRNTNVKASSLAFGPSAAAVSDMDAALARLPAEDLRVLRLADTARLGAWRVQALLPLHIAEESDQEMDEMEARMTKEDRQIRWSLDTLSALPGLAGNPDLATAAASYARFGETRAQILRLSRENTDVHSLTISLTRKRKVMSLCQDALAALQQAVESETIAGAPGANVVLPR